MIQKGDICRLKGSEMEPVDVVIGGSPCQNISISGNGMGLDGGESKLFFEQMRLISEMRQAGNFPKFMIWENVSNIYACNMGCDFRSVLAETVKVTCRQAGVAFLAGGVPKDGWKKAGALIGENWSVAWRLTNARFFGVPQSRRRIALVADFDGTTAPDILFGMKPLEGKPVRPVMFRKFENGTWNDAPGEVLKHSDYGEAPLEAREVPLTEILDPYADREFYLTVKACEGIFKRAEKRHKTISPYLRLGMNGNIKTDPRNNGLPEGVPVVVETLHHNGFGDYRAGDFSSALKASGGDVGFGSECLVVMRFDREEGAPQYAVRRLSVTECERAQGFPDNWTDIGAWTAPGGKFYPESPLSYRGKALGNSIALPQWEYVLKGILERSEHKTLGSLFDGIGGFPLIWRTLGGEAVWNSEIEPFPSCVTEVRFP